jgi:hypothetical protein
VVCDHALALRAVMASVVSVRAKSGVCSDWKSFIQAVYVDLHPSGD